MYSIEFNNVWKQYTKGDKMYALRDQIPALVRSLVNRKSNAQAKSEDFWAIQGVSFKMKKGESLGIIGPNGAGKSTILKLLSRITKPTKGNIKIRGRVSALIEVGAGFHPEFTGTENIFFNGAVLGMKQKDIEKKYDQIVDFSGVREFINTPVKRFSSGMRSRLGFAVAAHMDPDILLVDEVLSVGDLEFRTKCLEKMKDLFESGVTIIFISHNTPMVQALCQKALLLDEGRVIQEGPTEDVIPYYENLVNERRESDLRESIAKSSDKHRIKVNTSVKILDVVLQNKNERLTGSIAPDDPISVTIAYEVDGEIEHPVFVFEIFRSDKILCCHSNTQYGKLKLDKINGRGTIKLDIDKTTLGSGVYYTRVTVKDKDMMHTYVIAKKTVFKIKSPDGRGYFNSIFGLEADWSHVNGSLKK